MAYPKVTKYCGFQTWHRDFFLTTEISTTIVVNVGVHHGNQKENKTVPSLQKCAPHRSQMSYIEQVQEEQNMLYKRKISEEAFSRAKIVWKDFITTRNISQIVMLEEEILLEEEKHMQELEHNRFMTSKPRWKHSYGQYDSMKESADKRHAEKVQNLQSKIDALKAEIMAQNENIS